MPSVSKKQHNLMAAVAKNPQFAKRVGIKQSVGEEFLQADKGKKFSGGGKVATKKLFGGKETAGEELKEAKALKSGKISKSQYVAGEKSEGHGKGAAKTASAIKSGKISPKQYAQAETMMKKGGMTFGGKETKAEEARERKAAPSKAAYKKAEMKFEGEGMKRGGCATKKMAKGGLAAGHKSADGIATKGKTKARAVTMKKGGKC